MGLCRDCKYFYSNDTMGAIHICVNGYSEKLGTFTGELCEDDCPDCEEEIESEDL